MTSDDARVAMLKMRNLRESLMDSFTYLQGIGDAYDTTDTEFKSIMTDLYGCIQHVDRASESISCFATTKARNPDHWRD